MTYSLTLREPLGRKLTIGELDDNFLYLEDLASKGGGGSVNIDNNQIGFGSECGLTSSQFFTYDKEQGNLILGQCNQIIGGNYKSGCSSIISGVCNYI